MLTVMLVFPICVGIRSLDLYLRNTFNPLAQPSNVIVFKNFYTAVTIVVANRDSLNYKAAVLDYRK